MLLAANPPYRRDEVLALWEHFVERGEPALFDLMGHHHRYSQVALPSRSRRALNALVLAVV
jgi:hypothetical protein